MKRLCILLLVLAILLLPGCHNEMEDLLGTWQAELDMKQLLVARLEQECPGLSHMLDIPALPVTLELSFYADGTYQAQVQQQSVYTACQALRPVLEQGIWDYWQGLYPEGDLQAYLQDLGVTRQELMDEVIGDTLAQELILQMDIYEQGQFSVEKGKLRFSASVGEKPDKESWHMYQAKGKKLTLKPGEYRSSRDEAYYGEKLPIIFQKTQ